MSAFGPLATLRLKRKMPPTEAAYLSADDVNVVLSFVPSPVTTGIMATAI
jgi:hypothetical protein